MCIRDRRLVYSPILEAWLTNTSKSFLAVGSPPEKCACKIPIFTPSDKAVFHKYKIGH